ncbi:MAG: hypothetical protein ACE5FM_09330 [Methyloligellaceae bacterium]
MTHIAPSAPPTAREIRAMARVLARRYGARAGEIAGSFRAEHEIIGDRARAALWGEVCAQLEQIAAPPTLS